MAIAEVELCISRDEARRSRLQQHLSSASLEDVVARAEASEGELAHVKAGLEEARQQIDTDGATTEAERAKWVADRDALE